MKHLHSEKTIQPKRETKWIVVGDSSRFVVYEKKTGSPLAYFTSFNHPEAHLKISELVSDQPGRSFASFSQSHGGHQTGAPRHAYTSEHDPKAHSQEVFVQGIARFLNKSRSDREFQKLILVADPKMLSTLHENLDKETQGAISDLHPKNLSWLTGPALLRRIQDLTSTS